jgi:hypothetical protein
MVTFNAMLEQLPVTATPQFWTITAPDGEAKLMWNGGAVMMKVEAAPFIAAGLDVAQLPNVANGEIEFNYVFASGEQEKTTPEADGKKMIMLGRDAIGYHAALGHYGVTIEQGNLFEWAANMQTNDKDIVFALNPEPLMAAGVRPAEVDGWTLAVVPVDVNGRPTAVEKLLKPFDLLTNE